MTVLYEFTAATNQVCEPKESHESHSPAPKINFSTVDNASTIDEEYAFLKIRYKLPDEDSSRLITRAISKRSNLELLEGQGDEAATILQDFRFAAAVAGFSQLLKCGGGIEAATAIGWTFEEVFLAAESNLGEDAFGYKAGFLALVRATINLSERQGRRYQD